ncbi:polysaccharide biosynthesis/export family protein [Belliella sp. R4-6]|uniref:Polysaccharide biosynthesis/export family protein n=1 Tax=Belliella alkalica TaxID=1730871 RepID=A0ABS9V6N4_9BACT|nr:polysaccharide biosynthesis/export family protein [Belliella alkalica]MCH7412076.1 polysaccharide biosynthesis/export family protein [Belliella alkalica]
MIKSISLLLLSFLIFSVSCVPNKKIILLQNLDANNRIADGELIPYEIMEYRLQYNDIIDVQLTTSADMKENGFSPQSNQMNNNRMMGQAGGDIYYMTGYTVDKNGNIRLPLIDEVNVMQLTIEEARLKIEVKIKEYVKNELYVKVKLGGIRFATLGEFRRPGKYVVLQERMTIFEAIAQSGDLTTLAQRDDILLIRQYPEGSKIHRINLNDRNIIKSPYYFIQPNDMIYAEPMKTRELGAGENASQSLSLFISSISALVLIINLVTR